MSKAPMDHFVRSSETYPPVTDELLASIVQRVLAVGCPLKIVLFGSRARGDYSPDSDIDIFIIEGTQEALRDKKFAYNKALESVFPERTVIVRSLADVEQWRYVPNCLETEALRQGKVLYEDRVRIRESMTRSDGAGLVREEAHYRTPLDLAHEWIRRANGDLLNARIVLDAEGPDETICFHTQQAVEKYLKALLALHGARLEKTHDLNLLRRQCLALVQIPELSTFDFERLTSYAVEARYAEGFWPDRTDAQEAVALAEQVIQIIARHIPVQDLPDDQTQA